LSDRGYAKIKGIQPAVTVRIRVSYTTLAYSDIDIEPAKKEDDVSNAATASEETRPS